MDSPTTGSRAQEGDARSSSNLLVELARHDLQERADAHHTWDGPGGEKRVSRRAWVYLNMAQQAIDHTKQVITHQGNQLDAIRASKGNSYYRLRVMRNPQYWELTSAAAEVARRDPEAFVAAKADLVHGGNCGEHAAVAYNYLDALARGVTLQKASYKGLDHAFVILGNLEDPTEFPDHELVVSDPWPNTPRACLWEDHFAFARDRSGIEVARSAVSDGHNNKERIKAGLTLTPEGLALATATPSSDQFKKMVEDPEGWHFWDHEDAAETEYDYDGRERPPAPLTPRRAAPVVSSSAAGPLPSLPRALATAANPVAPDSSEDSAAAEMATTEDGAVTGTTATVQLPRGTGWYRVSVLLAAQGIQVTPKTLQDLNPGVTLYPGPNTVRIRP